MTNLITNACRYGVGKPIYLRVRSVGDAAILEVKDEGIGIALSDQERIFNRFERAGPRGDGGFGIGLFIVREIARLHGGQVGVRSELGKGSNFWFSLPKRAPA